MYQIKKVGDNRQIIEPKATQKVPVVFHVNDELMPEQHTIEELVNVASDERVFHHVAAMTDVHSKPGRMNPTGSVVATEQYIFPQTVDTAPNCGMRMFATPFSQDDLDEKTIDNIFNELVKVIPTKKMIGTPLSHRTVMEVSKRGSAAILEAFGEENDELARTMLGGNMFGDQKISDKELYNAIPRLFFRIAQLRMGILGAAGNHFLDLMKVGELLDKEKASALGLKENQYVFLMHTGSGMFGQYCSYFYTPKKKEHASQKFINELARFTFLNDRTPWHKQLENDMPEYEGKKEFYGIDGDSELGRNFMIAHKAAANHGFANRALLQIKTKHAIEKVLGKKVSLPLVYDMTHISIQKENHFNKDVWVHRNGAVRAFGPNKLEESSPYKKIGEPVFIPSSMSTPAFIGVGTNDSESTFFSAPHGTGKSKSKTSEVPSSKEELLEKMKKRGVRLYNGQSKGIVHQDASHYKNVEPAIEGLLENKVIVPVAKMNPVAVLMA